MPNESGNHDQSLESSLEKVVKTGSDAVYEACVGMGKPIHSPHSEVEKLQYIHTIQVRLAVWYAVYAKHHSTADSIYTAALRACIEDFKQWNRDQVLEYYYAHSGQTEIIEFSIAEQIQTVQNALIQTAMMKESAKAAPDKAMPNIERMYTSLLEQGLPAPNTIEQETMYKWTITIRCKVWFYYFSRQPLPFYDILTNSQETVLRELQNWQAEDFTRYFAENRHKDLDVFVENELQKLIDEENGEL